MTNKLNLGDRTDEYILLCIFGSRTISGYRVTGVGPPIQFMINEEKKKKERNLLHTPAFLGTIVGRPFLLKYLAP